MANEPDSQDASKPKRRPITIDLPAEEVGRKAAAEAGAGFGNEPPAPAGDASGSVDDVPKAEPASAEAKPSSGRDDKTAAPSEPVTPSAFAEGKAGPTAPKAPKWRPMPEPPPPPPPRPIVSMLVVAVLGGLVGAVVIAALVFAGYLGQHDDAGPIAEIAALKSEVAGLRQAAPIDLAPLQEQIAALEKSVAALSDVPPSETSGAALTELEGRVATLEQTGGPGASTADLEQRITELGEAVAALRNAAPADAEGLENALAPIRQQLEALTAQLEQVPTSE
ncbi:MAG: hypothetical protein ACREDV_06490, partial [Methylocella sp.]